MRKSHMRLLRATKRCHDLRPLSWYALRSDKKPFQTHSFENETHCGTSTVSRIDDLEGEVNTQKITDCDNAPTPECRRKRKGSATVEFAMVAPLLFAMVLGLIEVGRIAFVLNEMSNAAREGCRVAALGNVLGTDEVITTVDDYLASAALTGLDTTVSPEDLSTIRPGSCVGAR